MLTCIFCRIADHAAPAAIEYENDRIVAFRDVQPQAPVHILICPKQHIPTLNDVAKEELSILSEMLNVARELADRFGVRDSGYRTVFNVNANAGQTVFHLHLHLIGGRKLSWP